MVGTTAGNDLPVWRAVQPFNGGGPIFKSTDDGATWQPSAAGMSGTGAWSLSGSGRPMVLYSGALGGNLHRSGDQGGNWRALPSYGSSAVDPLSPSTLYAAGSSGAFKSTDGGENWSQLSLPESSLSIVAIAPGSSSNIYMASARRIYHSANGGVTWFRIFDLDSSGAVAFTRVDSLAVDPQNPEAVYATLNDRSVIRREGGQQWTTLAPLECSFATLYFAGGLTPAIFARSCGKVFKSTDRGGSWREVGFSSRTAAALTVDPSSPGMVYVASAHNGVYRSRDSGETWTRFREPLEQDVRAILVDGTSRTIYIGSTDASNAFVVQLTADGRVDMSTCLGGLNTSGARLAVDRNGTIAVAGTAGSDFPLVRPTQQTCRGMRDVFVARIIDPK